MKRHHTQDDSQSVDLSTYTTVVSNWLEATSTFYSHYNQLAFYTNRKYLKKGLHSITSRNPILVNKLRILLSKMKHELKKLLQDLDLTQAPNLTYAKRQYKTLIIHTRILNRLNQEAEIMNRLATLDSN